MEKQQIRPIDESEERAPEGNWEEREPRSLSLSLRKKMCCEMGGGPYLNRGNLVNLLVKEKDNRVHRSWTTQMIFHGGSE